MMNFNHLDDLDTGNHIGKTLPMAMTSRLSMIQLQDIIGAELHVALKDNRQITGVLLALDHKPNLLFTNAYEISTNQGKQNKRELGLVSVPDSSIVSIKIKSAELDKTLDWKANNII